MSRSTESRPARGWRRGGALGAAALLAAAGWAWLGSGPGVPAGPASVGQAGLASAPAASVGHGGLGLAASVAAANPQAAAQVLAELTRRPPLREQPLSPAARSAYEQLRGLASLPPGADAVAQGQALEAAYRPELAPGYLRALLETDDPAVERVAMGALARHGDGPVMLSLAAEYGRLQAERRGRVLQVLEQAENPAALPGLAFIVAGDASEKRSPLVMSAMYGAANIGSAASLEYLLGQLTPQGADLALQAMTRVHNRQGIEFLKGAAAGNKDAARIPPVYVDAVRRIADQAGRDKG